MTAAVTRDGLYRTVLRAGRSPGYVLIGPADRVFRRDDADPATVDQLPRHERETVTALIVSGALILGERCRVAYGSHTVPAQAVDRARGDDQPWRALVTGSRTWTDTHAVRTALADAWRAGARVLVVGACPAGADAMAEQFWRAWGGQVERHPADWSTHGRAAGFRRNAVMVAAGRGPVPGVHPRELPRRHPRCPSRRTR